MGGNAADVTLPGTSSPGAVSCFTFSGTGEAGVGDLQEYPRTVYSVDSPCACDLGKMIND